MFIKLVFMKYHSITTVIVSITIVISDEEPEA